MRWFWDYSHYRKAAGDLVLDRVFGHDDPTRTLPADFGVRVTRATVDAHLLRSESKLADWTAANAEPVTTAAACWAAQPASRSTLPRMST